MIDKLGIFAAEYVKEQCEDVKEALVYTPVEIKVLMIESYKDGYNTFYNELRKQVIEKFNLSKGQGISTEEYYKLGEFLGYEFGVI